MLILSLHHGPHDSSAALFDDYQILAAVAEERLNRIKCSGGFPEQALTEVLRIAAVERRDIDAVVCTRTYFLRRYFTHWKPRERLRENLRRLVGREKIREMNVVLGKDRPRSAYDIFDTAGFLSDLGLRPQTRVFFSNHHFSHALPALFFTDWDEALIYTADGAGDQVSYSHNLFRDGALTNLYGDDRWLGRQRADASLGLAYSFVTEALGWKIARHEGKLTGLAAFGEPTLLPEMQRHFRITDDARIEMDFPDFAALRECFHALARRETRENAAASVQALLEGCVGEAVGRLVERHKTRRLGLAGGVFANVRLNRLLAETLPVDEVFIVPPMGDDGLVVGLRVGPRDGSVKLIRRNSGRLRNGRGRGTARVDGYDLCRRQPRRCRCRTAQSAITLDAERRSGGGRKLGKRIGSRDSLAKCRRLDVDRTHARPFCGSRQHFITKRCSPSGPGEERIASSARATGLIEWGQMPSGVREIRVPRRVVLADSSPAQAIGMQKVSGTGIRSGQSATRRAHLNRRSYLAGC